MAKRSKTAIANLKVRLRESLRAKIERAAKSRGVSMNAEMVDRVDESFEKEAEIERLFGSDEVFALMKVVSSAMHLTGRFANTGSGYPHWAQNPVAYHEATLAAARVLEALKPTGPIVRPPHLREGTGEGIADAVIAKIIPEDAK